MKRPPPLGTGCPGWMTRLLSCDLPERSDREQAEIRTATAVINSKRPSRPVVARRDNRLVAPRGAAGEKIRAKLKTLSP